MRYLTIAITINRRECHTYYFVCSVAKSGVSKSVQKESLTNNLFFTSAVVQFVISTSFLIATINTVLSNTSAIFWYLFYTSENENSAAILRNSPKLGMNFNTPIFWNSVQTLSVARTRREHWFYKFCRIFPFLRSRSFRHVLERSSFHPHGSHPHPPVHVRELLVRPRCFV